jgi:hypothetical protein
MQIGPRQQFFFFIITLILVSVLAEPSKCKGKSISNRLLSLTGLCRQQEGIRTTYMTSKVKFAPSVGEDKGRLGSPSSPASTTRSVSSKLW